MNGEGWGRPPRFLLQRPARKLSEAVARRRARRRALAAGARMANDNDDPFWEPPDADGQAAHDEVAGPSGVSAGR